MSSASFLVVSIVTTPTTSIAFDQVAFCLLLFLNMITTFLVFSWLCGIVDTYRQGCLLAGCATQLLSPAPWKFFTGRLIVCLLAISCRNHWSDLYENVTKELSLDKIVEVIHICIPTWEFLKDFWTLQVRTFLTVSLISLEKRIRSL